MNLTIKDRHGRLARQFSAVLDDVAATDTWQATTPCEGWTVRDVLSHVVETNREFLARHVEVGPESDDLRSDWDAVATLSQEILGDERGDTIFSGYFGPTTIAEVIDGFYGMDLLVHRWDIARGAGLSEHESLDAEDAEHYLEVARGNGEALRMDGVCGPEVAAPGGATPGERLIAFLGRDPR